MHGPRVQPTLLGEEHRFNARIVATNRRSVDDDARRCVNNDILWTSNHEPQTGEKMCQQVHVSTKFDAPDSKKVIINV